MHAIILRKNYLTLIEMMIVMTLIMMIIGVLGYNYMGALDEGKAFKTKEGMQRLQTILSLAASDNPAILEDIQSNWQDVVRNSPLVQNPNALIKDGWGQTYQVSVEGGEIIIQSERYQAYIKSKPSTQFGEDK